MSHPYIEVATGVAPYVVAGHYSDEDDMCDEIATALAEAEREGMRRAAEICRRIDDQCGMEAGLAAACAESILSEAGIAVTD